MKNTPVTQSFIEFCDQFYKPILARSKKYYENTEDAEDATHDIILRVYNCVDEKLYMSPGFTGYLFRMVYYYFVDGYRKNKKRKNTEYNDSIMETDASNDSQDMGNTQISYTLNGYSFKDDAGLTNQIVKKCLGMLKEKDRNLLVMKYRDGLSYAEMAVATGRTTGWVGNELKRSEERLRKIMNENGYRREDFF